VYGADRAKTVDGCPRFAHVVDLARVHHHRAERVQENLHLDAGARSFAHRLREVSGDVALPVDVRLERKCFLGACDRFEDGREDRIAVHEKLDF